MCMWEEENYENQEVEKMNGIKKLKMWFWTKSKTIDEMIKISKIIEVYNKKLIKSLEELDQSKVYICTMPEASQEEVETCKRAFEQAARRMNWTMPKIIFLNTTFKEKKQRRVKKQ